MASLERRFSLFEVGASGSAPAAVSGSGRKRARVEIAAEREAMIEAACIEYKCGVQKLRGLYVLGKAKVSGLSAATKRLEPENRCKRCNEKMHDCIVLTENGDKYGGSIGPILPTANGEIERFRQFVQEGMIAADRKLPGHCRCKPMSRVGS